MCDVFLLASPAAQLEKIPRSLDIESVKALVHTFVTSRVNYCNSVLAEATKSTDNKMQRVLNAAARFVSGRPILKFDHGLSHLLHSDLHWHDIPRQVYYKLGLTVHPCLWQSIHDGAAAHSSTCVLLVVSSCSRHRLTTFGRRALSVASLNAKALPNDLWDPTRSTSVFCTSLKTALFTNHCT